MEEFLHRSCWFDVQLAVGLALFPRVEYMPAPSKDANTIFTMRPSPRYEAPVAALTKYTISNNASPDLKLELGLRNERIPRVKNSVANIIPAILSLFRDED